MKRVGDTSTTAGQVSREAGATAGSPPTVSRRALVVGGTTLLGTVLLTNHVAVRILGDLPATQEARARSPRVSIVSEEVTAFPSPTKHPTLLLLGNSHTYALPGLKRGDPLRPDPGATLVDELHRRLGTRDSRFYRIAYPNFGPIEMLLVAAHWLRMGHRPRVLVLGVTWRNVARGSDIRHSVRSILRDPGLLPWIKARVPDGPQSPLSALKAAAARVQAEMETERTRSHADVIDARIGKAVGAYAPLIGRSAELRVQVYRRVNYGVAGLLFGNSGGNTLDVVPSDLELNSRSLRALFQLLHRHGCFVVAYHAPERTDVPAIIDDELRGDFVQALAADVTHTGGKVVDAGRVVPNDLWGWERDTPDRSHFTEVGHSLLAEMLAERAGDAIGSALSKP